MVIATDDNAQKYFAKNLANKSGVSVVFCGVNADPAVYGYPAPNITGVREVVYLADNYKLFRSLVPGKKTFTVVYDKSATTEGAKATLEAAGLDIEVAEVIETDSFSELKERLKGTKGEAVILFTYAAMRDDNGNYAGADKIVRWISANIRKPSFGFNEHSVKNGVLLSSISSGFDHGFEAGSMALRILEGKKASEIPVLIPQKTLVLVNRRTALRLGIDIGPVRNVADKIYE